MESVPDTFPALFYGYTAFWLLLVIYLVVLYRKVKLLEDSIKRDKNIDGY